MDCVRLSAACVVPETSCSGLQGCYIGQETLAKVVNLQAVKQQLWGLRLTGLARAGEAITGALRMQKGFIGGMPSGSQLSSCSS
jgi:folate-binding Fe-S cluster repair protein YgfZ